MVKYKLLCTGGFHKMNRAWIELSREALLNNINEYRRLLPDGTGILAIVKANAYGHGAVQITKALCEMGVDFFGVASLDEAKELRNAGIKEDILILGYTDPEYFDEIAAHDIIQTVPTPDYGILLSDYCHRRKRRIRAHLAVDSGMHRIGYTKDDINEAVKLYDASPLKVTGIFTHMCVAGEDKPESTEYTEKQIEYFNEFADMLKDRGCNPGTSHLLASFAAINYTHAASDYVRLGVLMYGTKTEDADYISKETSFKPVLTLKSRVVSLRWIEAGETVGYGRCFTAERPTKVATISIGYADGIPRSLSNGRLKVLVRGEYAYGIGRICMDQLMIDVTDLPGVRNGDEVIFIGKDGDKEIRAEEVAESAGTITHELFSCLGARLERPKSI